MKTLYYLAALCGLLCVSCKNNSGSTRIYQADDSEFQVITVDPDAISQKEMFKFSTIADTIEYIPLETNDSVLIGNIKRLIVHKGVMYILDEEAETIFCFDTSGHFLHKLAAKGHGPNEYGSLSCFALDFDSGNMYIHSYYNNSVYIYDSTGVFLEKKPLDLLTSSIAIDGDRLYAYTGKFPNEYPDLDKEHQFQLSVFENGELKLRALPYPYKKDLQRVPLSVNNFTRCRDTLLLVEYLAPEIYTLDQEGQPIPRYRIDFTTNTIHPRFEDPSIDREALKAAEKAGEYTSIFGHFFESSRYIFFNYARGIIGGVYVDKRDGTVHNMGYFYMDDYNNYPSSGGIDFLDETYLYQITDPSFLILQRNEGMKPSPALDKQVAEMSDSDNPVIIRLRLK